MKNIWKNVIFLIAFGIVMFMVYFMSGCEQPKGPPLETECNYSIPITLTVVEYEYPKELAAQWEFYSKQKLPDNAGIEGFATHNTRTDIHTLHILKIRGQKDSRRIETLGHELLHSFCGDWHPPYPGT